MEFLAGWALWIKALHVISVIAWMAGMLYLPRLFVYHCGVAPGSEASEMLKVMERRLLKAIINPAMIDSFLFGGLLLATPGLADWSSGWLWTKLALVFFGMGGLHGAFSRWQREFAADRNRRTAKFYRFANEAPTLILIVVVILVIVRPF